MHPIIALWAHPRSMSTAVERIMRERGDLICMHEPFLYDYYLGRKIRVLPHFEPEPGTPTLYEDIRDSIVEAAERGPVFFKDMSYYVMPRILEDVGFAQRLTHCFLIRNPWAAIASYYRLDSEVTSDEIGLLAQWAQFQGLETLLGRAPLVMESEAIQADSRAMMTAVWQQLGLAYREEAFSWNAEEVPQDWQQVGGWHGKVSESGGIRAPSGDAREAAEARFNALAQAAPKLRSYLDAHLPAYEALQARAFRSAG